MRWSVAQALAWIMVREPLELERWTGRYDADRPDMGAKLGGAEAALAEAIAAGKVQAWGRRLKQQPSGEITYGPPKTIPSHRFRYPGFTMIVNQHGEMTTLKPRQAHEYPGPRWGSIEFDAEQIERAWPKPGSAGTAGDETAATKALTPNSVATESHDGISAEKTQAGVEPKPDIGEIKGAKSQGIAEAIDRLWPDGPPKGLTAKERNQAIIKELGKRGCSTPKNWETAIPRAIQRVLKKRKKRHSK
jgi:hypothetical protein